MPVAPRIVNHVSYVTTINHESDFCVAGAVFDELAVSLFVAGAIFDEVELPFFLAGRMSECDFSWQAQHWVRIG